MRIVIASYSAFAAFGLFWGTWGAGLPALRTSAAIDDAELGTALLFVGIGALPAMLFTGRAIDRFGARITGALLTALAASGVITAQFANDLATLAIGMALVGATSGAADVGANALAGLAEERTGRRIITISHAVFSSFVVIGSLGVGSLRAAGADIVVIFGISGILIAVAGTVAGALGEGRHASSPPDSRPAAASWRVSIPFVIIGIVAALGFAAENAHQSWSAVFLADELAAEPGITALAPATFAAFAALTRFAVGSFKRIPAGVLLVGGAALATIGTLGLSVAPNLGLALGGLALAAVGTSVLFPTLLSEGTRGVPVHRRGRATSAVATTAYLGFVLGPVYVGMLAGEFGLRTAMLGVALLIVAFAILAPVVIRRRESHSRGTHYDAVNLHW